jgi:phosphopantothenoylcysteine decarboxylase/phosphopantothenate--cysteine ligase
MTAFDLQSALQKDFPGADGLVMLAAVADYGPAQYSSVKRKKDGATWNVDFGETPDVLGGLRAARRPEQAVLAVSLEDTDWLARGQAKAGRKGADALLAVELGSELPFGDSRLNCALVTAHSVIAPAQWRSKDEAAGLVVEELAKRLALQA